MIGCPDPTDQFQLAYFGTFAVLFQFGWAVVQISHLSMIPGLSGGSDSERTSLTSIRYAATVAAFVVVYCVTWAWLGSAHDRIGPQDQYAFQNAAVVCVVVGGATSVFFHVVVKTPTAVQSVVLNDSQLYTVFHV